jgi:hypothetical protein
MVRLGVIALGVSGLLLLGLGFHAVLGTAGATTLADVAGVLGIAELVLVGRLLERRQTARLLALGAAVLQALGGVIALAQRHGLGLAVLVLAGLVVVPLASQRAERFFEAS